MAFAHLHATTTAGAADEVVDWFARFQAFMVGIGWVAAGGAGTTNLVLSSIGELGGLTMLFLHVWRDGGNPNRIRFEVQNDLAGTQFTTEGGYIDSGGVQFEFWISADRDAAAVVGKIGAGYREVYVGLVMPFALTVVDETYRMVSVEGVDSGRILRDSAAAWDQADNTYENPYMRNARRDRDDGSLSLGGLLFGDLTLIAGEFKHISCQLTDPATAAEDDITTGKPGATTTWTVFSDDGARKFALRTGGVLPIGDADSPGFVYNTGVAATPAAWFAALNAHMVGIGWAAANIAGLTGMVTDWEFNSPGESGVDDVWIRAWYNGGANIFFHIASAGFGTPGRQESAPAYGIGVGIADFPQPYHFAGDMDCLISTVRTPAGTYGAMWTGLSSVFAPNLTDTYMGSVINWTLGGVNSGRILHDHVGGWNALVNTMAQGDGPHALNSNPNAYDGTTYLIWPMNCAAFGDAEPIGMFKYFFASSGGGLAQLDTITIGARVYTVFIDGVPNSWAMRTV